MSAEKFYRNIAIAEVLPTKVSYPDTLVETRVEDQSCLLQRCNAGDCYFWVVVAEKEFLLRDKVLLPMSYLPWAANRIPVSQFEFVAFVGKISRKDYRQLFSLLKSGDRRLFKTERIIKNSRVAKILEMHYLGFPLMVKVRPTGSISRIHSGGLKIAVSGNLEWVELSP